VGCYLDWLEEAASGFPEQNIYSVLQSAHTVFMCHLINSSHLFLQTYKSLLAGRTSNFLKEFRWAASKSAHSDI
jgi:hypothetical protein